MASRNGCYRPLIIVCCQRGHCQLLLPFVLRVSFPTRQFAAPELLDGRPLSTNADV